MKGISAAIIVVVIVIVAAAVFLFSQNLLPIGTTTRTYDNTIIHLTQKLISDNTPLVGEKVSIMFSVANQGDKAVNDVSVNFFDMPGFSNSQLSCQTGDSTQMVPSSDGRTCDIMNIQPGDARQVSLTIVASGDTPQGVVSYSVGYDYSGTRMVEIPIIDPGATLPNGINYIVNPATVGPIQVSIEPPIGSQRVVNGNTVTENFARTNIPFTLKFSVSDVGNPEGTKGPIVLQSSSSTPGLNVTVTKFKIDQCDTPKLQISGRTATNDKALTVPDDTSITCVLEYDSNTPITPFEMGTVQISFNYHYSFTNTESFTIRSLQQ